MVVFIRGHTGQSLRRLIEAVIAAAVAAVVTAGLGRAGIQYEWFAVIDRWTVPAGQVNPWIVGITWFGTSEGVILISLVMLAFLFGLRLFQPALVFFVDLLTAAAANDVLKEWVGRPRPLQEGLVEAVGFSFPSGHAFVCTAVYGLFALILTRRFPARRTRAVICVVAVLFIGAIALSRILLGVHYTSDVVFGLLLGLAWLASFARAVEV